MWRSKVTESSQHQSVEFVECEFISSAEAGLYMVPLPARSINNPLTEPAEGITRCCLQHWVSLVIVIYLSPPHRWAADPWANSMSRPNLNPPLELLHMREERVVGWGGGWPIRRGGEGGGDPIMRRCRIKVCLFSRFDTRGSFRSRGVPLWKLCRGGLSSLADVTQPASVIETDANPAPLQSLAVGWGGPGRDGEGYWETRDKRRRIGETREYMEMTGLQRHSNQVWVWKTGLTSSSSSSAHLLEHLRGRDTPQTNPPSLDPDFNLEAKGHSEGFVEEERCGGCFPPPAAPAPSDASPEGAGLSSVRLGPDGEDVPLTAGEG